MIRPLPTPPNAGRLALLVACALLWATGGFAQHDLSIFRVSSDNYVQRGDIVSFTFVVTNDKGTDVTGVSVQVDLPSGLEYIRHSLSQNFDPTTGRWMIGSIRFFQPQKVITIDLRAVGEGVQIALAEIATMDGTDSDSTPGNGVLDEDDIVAACVTVPIRAECGQSVRVEAPGGYPAYEWYRDGVLLTGETANVINVGSSGRYNFQIPGSTSTCVLGSCCPAEVTFDSVSVALSQNQLCTGGFDTVQVAMPEVDTVNLIQVYAWSSIDDPGLRFLSCVDCPAPRVVINGTYLGARLRYRVGVVSRDRFGNVVCSAGATLSIEVLQAPVLTFDVPDYACADLCHTLVVAPDLETASVAWDGPNLRSTDGLTMTYCPRAVTAYTRQRFVVTVVGLDGCVRVDSTFVTTIPGFWVVASGEPRLCQGLPAQLSVAVSPAQPSDSLRYLWSEFLSNPNAGTNLSEVSADNVTTDSLTAGSYGFRVSVQRLAPNGEWVCAYEDTHEFEVEADCQQPRLGGYTWHDDNRDGLRQNFEPPFASVRVELFRANGTATGLATQSDATGFYEFTDLAIGEYYVEFAPQPNFTFSLQNVGTDEFIDSDADFLGRSDVFATTYDEALHLVGAGYVGDCGLTIVDLVATPSDCGDSRGSLSFEIAGGSGRYTYKWLPAVSTTTRADRLPAGAYQVTVRDQFTACELTQVLEVPGTSNFNLTASSSPAACPLGKGGSITVFTDGGVAPFTVSYTGPDAGSASVARMPFTVRDIHAGEYSVSVADASGCRQQIIIVVTENPMLLTLDTTDVRLPSCPGRADGEFTVAVSGFADRYTLRLDGQIVAANATVAQVIIQEQTSGSKVLELTDVNECLQRFEFFLPDGGPRISLADLIVEAPNCFKMTSGGIRSTNGRGYEVRAADGTALGTLPVAGLGAGTYTLVDRSVPGCVATLDVVLAEPAELMAAATAVGADCQTANGSLRVELGGGTAPYTVVWADGLGGSLTQNNLSAGAYAVTVSDANGCSLDTVFRVPDLCSPLVCTEYFTADTVVVYAADNDYAFCLPNFMQPINRAFYVNGAAVEPAFCTRSELTYYNLEALPGDGQAGPYLIEFWYGGDDIVIAEIVNDGEGFAEALNDADKWGRWRYDATNNYLSGGQPDRGYGEVEVTHVATGNKFYLTPSRLPNQISGTLTFPLGGFKVVTEDARNACRDSLYLRVERADRCRTSFVPASTRTATPYCDQLAPVCIDVPFQLLKDHRLLVNGQPYTGSTEACDLADEFYYDLSGLNLAAAFRMESWIVDGRSRTARLSNVEELAARMTQFDNRTWRYDARLGVVRGGTAPRNYRNLTLVVDGKRVTLTPQRRIFDGTRIELLAGNYAASLVAPDGCVGDFGISLRCSSQGIPTRDTVRWTVGVGLTDTACVATAQLSGPVELVENFCPSGAGVFASVSVIDSVCYRVKGLDIGTDTLCVRACDADGVCDTTIVIIDVRDPRELLYPLAVDDVDSVGMNQTKLIEVLANDDTRGTLVGFEVVVYPMHGRVRIEGQALRYTPEAQFCGQDSLVYEICNAAGCDRAVVRITMVCDQLVIYSGFSPNFDGVNETFEVLGVEQYPGNRMEVYNRGGNLVFAMDDYDNSWDGTYFDGDELPEGTYFYVFEDGRGREYTGYVYLRR